MGAVRELYGYSYGCVVRVQVHGTVGYVIQQYGYQYGVHGTDGFDEESSAPIRAAVRGTNWRPMHHNS